MTRRRSITPHQREITAYHEAGHVIMAATEGLPVKRAAVHSRFGGRNGNMFGIACVPTRMIYVGMPTDDLIGRAIVDVGGWAGETLAGYDGEGHEDEGLGAAMSEYPCINEEERDHLRRIWQNARDIALDRLDTWRPQFCAVANLLWQEGRACQTRLEPLLAPIRRKVPKLSRKELRRGYVHY